MTYALQALIACATTCLLIVWMRRPAERFGLVDHPGGRKRHANATPLTGGLAITLSLFFALSASLPALSSHVVLLVAVAVLALTGIYDDRRELFPRTKLAAQVFAAVLMTSWGNHFLVSLGDLFGHGPVELWNWSIPLTVFAAVAVINAINTFDGLDGLAGSLVLAMLGYFAGIAWMLGDANSLKFIVVLMGAIVGFLAFNAPLPWRGPRAFMGDTGSMVLGFVVVWFAIDFTLPAAGRNGPAPVTMLWVVGIVLLDFFTVTMRRLLRRRSPASPDRGHIHHLLVRRGFSAAQTVLILVAVNAALGAVGMAGWLLRWPEHWMFGGFLAVGTAYFLTFLMPARFMRIGRRAPRTPRRQAPAVAAGLEPASFAAEAVRPAPIAAAEQPVWTPAFSADGKVTPITAHAAAMAERQPAAVALRVAGSRSTTARPTA